MRLREKNQLTLPEEIASAMHAQPGETFTIVVDPADPDGALIRRVRASYHGALEGVYGSSAEEADAYVRRERDSWEG